jgi:hypothetical protein
MSKVTVEKVTLPAFLASALVNGDVSGLSDEDLPWVDLVHERIAPGQIVGCSEEKFFECGPWFDLPGFKMGADALEFDVLYIDCEPRDRG